MYLSPGTLGAKRSLQEGQLFLHVESSKDTLIIALQPQTSGIYQLSHGRSSAFASMTF